jgi:large subunit ribosomal protein L13
MTTKEYTIDAAGRNLGRVASEVALKLRGKETAQFERHIAPDIKVKVINASKIKLTGKKESDKYYKHYTGFPGGMRYTPVERMIERKGRAEVLRHAVHGMLPGNKLRPILLKKLTISE